MTIALIRVTKMLDAHCPPIMKGSEVDLNEFGKGTRALFPSAGDSLLISIHDSTAGKIVGRDFHSNSIA
jgi:hypothetical protein